MNSTEDMILSSSFPERAIVSSPSSSPKNPAASSVEDSISKFKSSSLTAVSLITGSSSSISKFKSSSLTAVSSITGSSSSITGVSSTTVSSKTGVSSITGSSACGAGADFMVSRFVLRVLISFLRPERSAII